MFTHFPHRLSASILLGAGLAGLGLGHDASATFIKIADRTTLAPNTGTAFDPSQFRQQPIVDNGAVYFVGGPDINTNSVYRYDPVGGLTTFADATAAGISQFDSFSVDAGKMAYVGTRTSNALTTLGVWDGTTQTFLADNTTAYPISTINGALAVPTAGDFSSLGAPHILGDQVVFRGGFWGFTGGNHIHEGIFRVDLSSPSQLEVVADIGTIAPGQVITADTFSHFATRQTAIGFEDDFSRDQGGPVIDAAGNIMYTGFEPGSTSAKLYTVAAGTGEQTFISFFGSNSPRQWDLEDGVITTPGAQIGIDAGGLQTLFETDAAIPGTTAVLSRPGPSVSVDGGRVLFVGIEPSGRSAIYLWENNFATELVSTDEVLDGRNPRIFGAGTSAFQIGNESLDGDHFAFSVDLPHPTIANLSDRVLFTGEISGASRQNPILPVDPSSPLFTPFEDLGLDASDFPFFFNTDGDLTWIDPPTAIGYDYEIIEGPDVASITLPDGFGDDVYQVFIYDEGAADFVLLDTVDALTPLDLPAGTTRFRVLGIEPDAGIDPTDPLGFPTGLTFAESGTVAMVQSAIVPEPGTAVLAGIGVGLVFMKRRR